MVWGPGSCCWHARRTAQTGSRRQATLQRKSTCERERILAETPEVREARLQQMRDRLAAETPEEREARLRQMRDRLAAETPEERSKVATDEG